MPVGPAQAQGFFDGLFGGPRYEQRDNRRTSYGRENRDAPSFWWGGGPQEPLPPQPQAYVSSPKYYTYTADAPETVSFAALGEIEVAAVGPLGPTSGTSPFAAAQDFLASFSLRVLPEVGAAINSHYHRYPEFLWFKGENLNSRAYSALTTLGRADEVGLSSVDYAVEVPRFNSLAGNARASAKVEFELKLSAAVLTYILDANRGRIDPNRISGYHDFARKTVDLAGALLNIAAERDVGAYLDSQNPDNAAFVALKAELERLRAAGTQERIEIAEGTLLKPGAASPELANIVAAIRIAGSENLKETHSATLAAYKGDPAYTPELVELVSAFQRERGLNADGVVGPNTIRALVPESNGDKIRKVEIALEQLRWLPRDFGARHVFINQPAFVATYFEEGRDSLSMRIVVGQKSNQTYFFADEIETVEYNPYWGVPRSIIVNEMLPKLYADPTYLDRAGYEVSTGSGRVSSAAVDWGAVATRQASVDVRQPPGRGNALGAVKILFPNAHAIYMHDTPHKDLFGRDSRAFSHGCVRLEAPREMAAAVLGKTVDYVDGMIAQGRNFAEDIPTKIPVYVSYFTAWPEPDGTVRYYGDVYDRDSHMVRAFEATTSARHAEG